MIDPNLIAQGLIALLQVYRSVANKPADWIPTAADWDALEAFANRTPEQIKADAAKRASGNP